MNQIKELKQANGYGQYLQKKSTLNYSGILTSPYEYYEKEDETQKRYSKVFEQTVTQKHTNFNNQNPDHFKWGMGSIDPNWKKRYSPLNLLECGVKLNKKQMMTQNQFLEEWERNRKETQQEVQEKYFKKKYKSQEEREKMKETEIGQCRQFDLFCYRAILKVIYGDIDLEKQKVSADKYLEERKQKFSKSYLDEQKKISQTISDIKSGVYDCFCLQEINSDLLENINKQLKQEYYVIEEFGINSIILLKKQSFGQFDPQKENQKFLQEFSLSSGKSQEQIKQILRFNKDSIFQALPDNILLLSIHLSSKKAINEKQLKEVMEVVEILCSKGKKIIFAGDFNAYFKKSLSQTSNKIEIFPESDKQYTANKKRTMMQPQRHKAEKLDQMSKDFIFTNLKIINKKVQLLNGKQINHQSSLNLLPTDEHPYDHYSVSVTIEY